MVLQSTQILPKNLLLFKLIKRNKIPKLSRGRLIRLVKTDYYSSHMLFFSKIKRNLRLIQMKPIIDNLVQLIYFSIDGLQRSPHFNIEFTSLLIRKSRIWICSIGKVILLWLHQDSQNLAQTAVNIIGISVIHLWLNCQTFLNLILIWITNIRFFRKSDWRSPFVSRLSWKWNESFLELLCDINDHDSLQLWIRLSLSLNINVWLVNTSIWVKITAIK